MEIDIRQSNQTADSNADSSDVSIECNVSTGEQITLGVAQTDDSAELSVKSTDQEMQVTSDASYVVTDITNLPPATELTLGGVIVGDGLDVTSNGTLSVNMNYLQEHLTIDPSMYVKKDLSILADADLTKRDSQLYVYENGYPRKTTIAKLVDSKIRTVEEVPSDFTTGNYIFREVK